MTTIIITSDEVKARLFTLLAGQETPTFVSIKNYQNNQGEISNYVINIGASYGNAKNKDTEFLSEPGNLAAIEFGSLAPYSEDARIALLTANLNPSNQSEAQTDTYTTICPNVRMHNDTGRIYIFGFKVSKTVLVEGVYPKVNSRPLTLAKEKSPARKRGFGMS